MRTLRHQAPNFFGGGILLLKKKWLSIPIHEKDPPYGAEVTIRKKRGKSETAFCPIFQLPESVNVYPDIPFLERSVGFSCHSLGHLSCIQTSFSGKKSTTLTFCFFKSQRYKITGIPKDHTNSPTLVTSCHCWCVGESQSTPVGRIHERPGFNPFEKS